MADSQIDQMVAGFLKGFEGKPSYALNVVGLAEVVLGKNEKLKAFELASKALAAPDADSAVAARAGAVLGSLLPGYHVPMMNDARRNVAWDAALRRAIRPGMRVLEIGTGGGMLALMAARAGAERVTTCEKEPVAAAVAREIARDNGYGDVMDVVAKGSRDLRVGVDLERPADLLFCDIFANTLVEFDPLPALADARKRLLAPGAPVIPAAGSLMVALGSWEKYAVACRAETAAGFDIRAFAKLRRAFVSLDIGDPGVRLHSAEAQSFRFDFSSAEFPERGTMEVSLAADCDGTVEGVIQWIRLELDAETVLQPKPEPGAVFFSAPLFWPLPEPKEMATGDVLKIVVSYEGKHLRIRQA